MLARGEWWQILTLKLRLLIFLFAGLLCCLPAAAQASQEFVINDILFPGTRLVNVDGHILISLSEAVNAFGLTANYEDNKVVLSKDGISLEFASDSKGVWSGGKLFCLDVPPQFIASEFYLPLRFLAESLGAEVLYSDKRLEVRYPVNRDSDIVLNFAGDTTLASCFEENVGDDFSYPFAKSPWFGQADLTMVNLENPVTDRGYKILKQFNFRMPPKYIQVLLNGGIDIVNLANNHVWDYSWQGLDDTFIYLDNAGIKYVGAGTTTEEENKPVILEVKGRRIGFLGIFSNVGNFEECISELKQKVDLVIVNFHWGVERASYPDYYQVNMAHRAVDAGADLVIGHHPHVLQGMERYHDGIIAYSLGNFIFGGNCRRQHDTVVLQLIIRGNLKIPAVIPVRVADWQPYLLEGEEGRMVGNLLREYSSMFENPLL